MRALLLILDGVGIGAAPDAVRYGDTGADTLGHVLDRFPDLELPALWSLGLGHVLDRNPADVLHGSYGRMRERGAGKDSTTGHWELAGVSLEEPFGVYNRFPQELVSAIEAAARVHFIGNFAASGTEIIRELGPQHLQTGEPILYTSADSVLQIAAHEEIVPLRRLYDMCRIARRLCDDYRIGRVIARPFVGEAGNFTRTAGRHDFSMQPPRTVLNALQDAGVPVIGIGKVADLFAGEGITESHPTLSNKDGMHRLEQVWRATTHGLIFANLVDFDTQYGHRRDASGFADALEACDNWLGEFLAEVRPQDLLLITADHGNDPTFRGTDHTREEVPLLMRHRDWTRDLGCRESFADVAATLAVVFGLPEPWSVGRSLLGEV